MNNKDIDGMWDYFCAKINNAVELFAPTNSKKRAILPKWMNKASRLACKAKANKWKVYRNSRTYNDLVEYRFFKKKADLECHKAKKSFENKVAENIKKNPKSFYAYVR